MDLTTLEGRKAARKSGWVDAVPEWLYPGAKVVVFARFENRWVTSSSTTHGTVLTAFRDLFGEIWVNIIGDPRPYQFDRVVPESDFEGKTELCLPKSWEEIKKLMELP